MTPFAKMYSQNDELLYWSLLHGIDKNANGMEDR